MNFQEIKEILEKNNITGDKFANITENHIVPDDFKASPEVQSMWEKNRDAWEAYVKSKYTDEKNLAIYQETSGSADERDEEYRNLLGLGEIEEVHLVGDREGGGDYSCKVFHFKQHNVYIKIEGYYSSYNGTDWNDNLYEVVPQEKKIIVYN